MILFTNENIKLYNVIHKKYTSQSYVHLLKQFFWQHIRINNVYIYTVLLLFIQMKLLFMKMNPKTIHRLYTQVSIET